MSLLWLYLRSRQVAVSTLVAVGCAVGMSLPQYATTAAVDIMAMFAVAGVVSITAVALGAPDPALDRTAALPWRWRRCVHVVAVGALAACLGLVLGPADQVVRNAIGFAGLAALAVTVLGGGLAWTLPLTWSVLTAIVAMSGGTTPAPLLTWPAQPAGTTAATVAACVLGATGLVAYAFAGPRLGAGTATATG